MLLQATSQTAQEKCQCGKQAGEILSTTAQKQLTQFPLVTSSESGEVEEAFNCIFFRW